MKINRSNYLLFILTQLHIQAINGQAGDVQYAFEVQVHTYMNSQSLNSRGQCCDGRARQMCRAPCRNTFQFCLRLARTRQQNLSCPLGFLEFDVDREDDNIVFNNGSSIVSDVALANPLVFEGIRGQQWPVGGVQLLVAVLDDHDNDNDLQLVDEISIEQPDIQPSFSFSSSAAYSGFHQDTTVQIELSFRLRCVNNYFGDNCETLCIPQDNELGHFACDGDGNIVCLAGYSDPGTQCTKCIPTEGCVPNQGNCEKPGECKCLTGYMGVLCEIEVETACESGDLCLNGGSCVIKAGMEEGYRCDCTEGYQGEKCETVQSGLGNNTDSNLNGRSNTTTETSDPPIVGKGQIAGGGVAGIVIAVLLVVIIVIISGAVIAIVFYKYKPYQKYLKSKHREALENPTYDMLTGISLTDRAVVHRSSTHNPQSNGQQTNGGALFHSVDNSNPLYASTQIDSGTGSTDGIYYASAIYDTPEGTDFQPAHPLTTSTLPTPQSNQNDILRVQDQSYSRSMENLLVPPSSAEYNGSSTHSIPSRVNPYGDYGDKTLQRVVSNYSLDDQEAGNKNVFDNPDYEDVQPQDVTTTTTTGSGSAAATAIGNNDYEDINDKDYDDID